MSTTEHTDQCAALGLAGTLCWTGEDGRAECVAQRDADPQQVADTARHIRTVIEPAHGRDALISHGGDLIAQHAARTRGADPDQGTASAALAVVLGPHPEPRRGMRFVHAHQLEPQPGVRAADTPRRVMRVTRVTRTAVHYRRDDNGTAGQWYTDRDAFADTVGAYVTGGA